MNNLHRELAPISDAAWSQIEEETTRTLKRYLAGRRIVDVPSPGGIALPGVGTGHLKTISAPAEGIIARRRVVKSLVELRVPFELSREAIDDVERGSMTPTGSRPRTPQESWLLQKIRPFSMDTGKRIFRVLGKAQAIRSRLFPQT